MERGTFPRLTLLVSFCFSQLQKSGNGVARNQAAARLQENHDWACVPCYNNCFKLTLECKGRSAQPQVGPQHG